MPDACVRRDDQNLWDLLLRHLTFSRLQIGNRQVATLRFFGGLSCLLHLSLKFFNLDQVSRIKRQRWVITVRLVCAETAVVRLLPAGLHGGRQPELLKIPIKVAEVTDSREVFTR